MSRLTTAFVATKPQFLAVGEIVVEHHKDDRNNDVTEVYYHKVCTVGDREYRIWLGQDYGVFDAAQYLAHQELLGNQTIASHSLVYIEDIGAVSQFMSEEFYNQTVEVCF